MGKFTNNLATFFSMMEDRGFTVQHMQWMDEEEYLPLVKESDYDGLARKAENVEECNVVLGNGDYRQAVMVMYSGDDWCDYVPICDWTFKHNHPDVVDEVIEIIRSEMDE